MCTMVKVQLSLDDMYRKQSSEHAIVIVSLTARSFLLYIYIYFYIYTETKIFDSNKTGIRMCEPSKATLDIGFACVHVCFVVYIFIFCNAVDGIMCA